MRITVHADGSVYPRGVLQLIAAETKSGRKRVVRHFVCRRCLTAVEAPEGTEVVHDCAFESDG